MAIERGFEVHSRATSLFTYKESPLWPACCQEWKWNIQRGWWKPVIA